MKTILLTLAALAMVVTVPAGQKSAKSACCSSSRAKGAACSAQASAKSACCAGKKAAAMTRDPFAVKGGAVLLQLSKR